MKYRVRKKDKTLKGEIKLEGSKSITNRVLMIKAMCSEDFDVKNYSNSEDSRTLLELINSQDAKVLHAKDGGTTIRFMLAYLAVHEGETILTGSEQLIERPIGPLVDALVSMGAEIQYLGRLNYPPLLIHGKMLKGSRVDVESDMSSQFVSALLLIAPILRNGLILRIKGEMVSKPYIEMTLQIMKHFDIRYDWSQNMISIPRQNYTAHNFNVESDWSSASYFYEMAAFADEVDLKLTGLSRVSTQGDSMIARIMEQFGVATTFTDNAVRLTKHNVKPRTFEYDFRSCPDIAPTMLATCAGLHVPARLTGIEHLKIKESDRIGSMQKELSKLGAAFQRNENVWTLNPAPASAAQSNVFQTHNDHRMAMCFASLAMTGQEVIIEEPDVVRKSYPRFWDDLKKVGFEVEEVA